MNFALNVPVNSVSFGQLSILILRELYTRGISPNFFGIGNSDVNAQPDDQDFNNWLSNCLNKSHKLHKRTTPVFKLWHLNASLDSFSKKQGLYFFHETDFATPEEINVINNQDVCFSSSRYTKEVFDVYGADKDKVVYCPPGFDSFNYHKTNKDYLGKDTISFSLQGKMENRKNTLRIIKLWAKKFGNDRKYALNCLVFNPFVDPKQQEAAIVQALENVRYWNITFHPYQQKNASVNDFINANQIDLSGLSGCEGFNLGLFNSLCLGKWPVVLNAHVHRDYCTDKNSILVEPTAMRIAEDGMFFKKGDRFSQGNWFDFVDEAAVAAMEKAVAKAHTPNPEGEKLKAVFTVKRMVDIITESMNKLV